VQSPSNCRNLAWLADRIRSVESVLQPCKAVLTTAMHCHRPRASFCIDSEDYCLQGMGVPQLSTFADATLKNEAGSTLTASQIWAGQPTVLYLVRRPGCGERSPVFVRPNPMPPRGQFNPAAGSERHGGSPRVSPRADSERAARSLQQHLGSR